MHDLIFKSKAYKQEIDFNLIAQQLKLDTLKFKNDFEDNRIIIKLLKNNKYLLSKGIVTTPTFIVNNEIIDDKYALYRLENKINEYLKQ